MADSSAVSESGMGGSSRKGEGEAALTVPQATGSHSLGIEETSPDMLKNTPSNIMRLADEIQQCEGRQKYLAQTRSPSDGGDVRWYFCKVPLAENGTMHIKLSNKGVPKLAFIFFFSKLTSYPLTLLCTFSSLLTIFRCCSSKNVDLVKRHCFPVYWNGENRRVLRGHWFACKGGLDWVPLREDVSEQLEFAYRSKVWHRRTFQPSGLFAARVDLHGSTLGLHALFTGEDDTWEAWLSVDASGFSNVISLGGNDTRLRRGYAASQSSKPTQVLLLYNYLFLVYLHAA
ncbi:hypothetical protein U1Q18_025752 [Sarracenia purpurea var. burkii]